MASTLKQQALLKTIGSPVTPEEAEKKYGLLPRNALCLREKKQDFIFEPDFLSKITAEIKKRGGEIKTNWRLRRVYIDPGKNEGGVLEFHEINNRQEIIPHYRAFMQTHLSLGPTPYSPAVYDLLSVTGVSMNALLLGADLRGGPLVCGGSNHVVPLLAPRHIAMKDPTCVTFARLSAAGSVSPLNRGAAWYNYDGRHAVHLLHRVRETLPENVKIIVLSVTGCNRVIGKDGRQVELHPTLFIHHQKVVCKQVTIQIGAGGGGLTQMGVIPQQMKESLRKI